MKWEPRIQQILDQLCTLYPEAVADDNGPSVSHLTQKGSPRFELNRVFAEQVCYEFGGNYGLKRADPGRPISSENLCTRIGNQLIGWAWENKHNGEWEQYPESEDLTGQVFVPVTPIDHIGISSDQSEPDEIEDSDQTDPNPFEDEEFELPNDEIIVEFLDRFTKHMEAVEKWHSEVLTAIKEQNKELTNAIKNMRIRIG